MKDFTAVGKRVPRLDAREKVMGKASYCEDLVLPGMLHAKICKSTKAHASIVSIDVSKAENLPGVRGVITGRDIPNIKWGRLLEDRQLIATDRVRFIGEPVAVVAADSIDIAEEAVRLIRVDYEELPAVFDPEEAIKPDPPAIIHPEMQSYARAPLPLLIVAPDPELPNVFTHLKIRKGDVEKGFQEADLVMENRFSRARIHHATIEPHAAVVRAEADGGFTIWATDQGVYMHRYQFAGSFGIPPSKVRVIGGYLGGGFGGKNSVLVSPLAAVLSRKTGRPVKMVLTREEVFSLGTTDTEMIIYIKDGVMKDGTLVARKLKLILNGGAYSGIGVFVAKNCQFGAVGSYSMPHFRSDSYSVATNTAPAGPFRSFGAAQLVWAIESQMDMLAHKLGIDPVEMRRKNLLKEGEKDVTGHTTYGFGAKQCLDRVAEYIGTNEKLESSYPWKRGKGIALANKYTMIGTGSAAAVRLLEDGVLEVLQSATEMGQGSNTVLAQIVAEEFGVSVDKVRMVTPDTGVTPFDYNTVSSRVTYHMGNALRRACQDAKQQVFLLASKRLDVPPEKLAIRGGKVYVEGNEEKAISTNTLFVPGGYVPILGFILGKGQFNTPYSNEDPETGQAERTVSYYAHGAAAVEVEVNVETGQVRVLKIGEAWDMGQPINPQQCEAQIDGGMGMGIGTALHEKMIIQEGKVTNANFRDYKMVNATDMPSIEHAVTFLEPVPHKDGPFGAKGFSEGSLIPVTPAIGNAIYDALKIRMKDAPVTPEDILKALEEVSEKGVEFV
ncbi:MAG: xanthine dehydrogenase family protein molybdopterin-binding subunit [Pseudomonadota bacterium]